MDTGKGRILELKRYIDGIPLELRGVLVPHDPGELAALARRLKGLQLMEEEREYVMELQTRFGLSLRPNETVKQTMIRVRLAILKERNMLGPGARSDIEYPIDPLE